MRSLIIADRQEISEISLWFSAFSLNFKAVDAESSHDCEAYSN